MYVIVVDGQAGVLSLHVDDSGGDELIINPPKGDDHLWPLSTPSIRKDASNAPVRVSVFDPLTRCVLDLFEHGIADLSDSTEDLEHDAEKYPKDAGVPAHLKCRDVLTYGHGGCEPLVRHRILHPNWQYEDEGEDEDHDLRVSLGGERACNGQRVVPVSQSTT